MKKLLKSIALVGSVWSGVAYTEENIFENNEQGYLYNIGASGYVFNAQSKRTMNAQSTLAITRDPQQALPIKIIRKPFRGITYSLIVASSSSCHETQRTPGNLRCVFKYQKRLGRRTGFVISGEADTFNNYFMFSLPLTRDTNGFQIYNQGKCITADSMGVLDLEECIDASTKTKENQLFRWVSKKWFDSGISMHRQLKDPYWIRKKQ